MEELVCYRTYMEAAIVKRAAEILAAGSLIIYPTDTVYGIGADATNQAAVDAVYALKKRVRDQPISVIVADFAMLKKWAAITKEQEVFMKERLPGPWTFILKPKKKLPVSSGNIGFRIPNHWCRGIVMKFGKPVTTTSANIHDQPIPETIYRLRQVFGNKIALYIDGGKLHRPTSTVVDLTVEPPNIVRD